MNWDDMKLFLALIRSGTVRTAAKSLGVSHSTVARRIDALESKLEVRLFDRPPSGYVLTAAGEDMLAVANQVEMEIEGLERRILGHDTKLSGQIRLTMVDALATDLLMPHIVAFVEKYPEIDLELEVSYEAANLDYREADIALRFAANPPDHLIGRRLVTCATAAYASKSYLGNHDLQDAESGCWIGFGGQTRSPKWLKESAYPHLQIKGRYISLTVQREACKAGMGLAMLPCFLGDNDASLTRLSARKSNPKFELWLLTHRDMRTNARIRVFAEFLTKTITKLRPQLEGVGS